MTCRDVADFILDYLTNELPPDVRVVFDRHLRRCENCREYLASYAAVVTLGQRAFRDDHDPATSAGIPDELVRAILDARSRQ